MTTACLTLTDLPIGALRLTANDHALINIEFLNMPDAAADDSLHHPILEQAAKELCAYLAGHCHHFTVPLEPQGTPFQQRVWQALQAIPWGEVRSYGEIADAIQQPDAARAVGMANNKNPLPIMIPCHRVVGSKGQLTGYSGGLTLKEQLLALEQAQQSMALI